MTGDLRIVPTGNTFVVELTYRVKKEEEKAAKHHLDPERCLASDFVRHQHARAEARRRLEIGACSHETACG